MLLSFPVSSQKTFLAREQCAITVSVPLGAAAVDSTYGHMPAKIANSRARLIQTWMNEQTTPCSLHQFVPRTVGTVEREGCYDSISRRQSGRHRVTVLHVVFFGVLSIGSVVLDSLC